MFHFVMTSVMLLQTSLISIYFTIHTPLLSISISALFCPQDKSPHGLFEQVMSCGREKFGPQKTENSPFFCSMYSLIFSKRPITLDSTLSIHQGVRLGQRGVSAKRKGQTTEFVFVA